jgi:hypothetical protein
MPSQKCTKRACASATKRQPVTSPSVSGGGLVNDLGKLAIPLAFIVANNGLKSMTQKKAPASKPRTVSARRAAVGGSGDIIPTTTASGGAPRARVVSKRGGGGDDLTPPAPLTGGSRKAALRPPKLLGGAENVAMPSPMTGGRSRPTSAMKKGGGGNASAYGAEGASYGSLTGGGGDSDYIPMSGGSLSSRKHAAVRNEFNKMAMEVKSFLDSRRQ